MTIMRSMDEHRYHRLVVRVVREGFIARLSLLLHLGPGFRRRRACAHPSRARPSPSESSRHPLILKQADLSTRPTPYTQLTRPLKLAQAAASLSFRSPSPPLLLPTIDILYIRQCPSSTTTNAIPTLMKDQSDDGPGESDESEFANDEDDPRHHHVTGEDQRMSRQPYHLH